MAEEVIPAEEGVQDQATHAATTDNKNTELNLTINADTSLVNELSIYKLGFSLHDLYKLSLQFYKKEKDVLSVSYQDKVLLVALYKQASCGKYDESKLPETGYFDVIGNDRRKTWESLGNLAMDDAKKQFCELLEKNSSSYTPYIEVRKREIEAEIERKRKEEEERKRKEEEEKRIRFEEEQRIRLALEAEKLKIQEEERLKKVANDTVDAVKPQTDDTPKLIIAQVNGTATGKNIAPASLWTRPKLQEFINHVKRDASSVLVVGRGETVTIRVPTHEHGSCLFWEFATESYDVGFGVYFEWSTSKTQRISVSIDESDNEDQSLQEKIVSVDQIVVNENENNIEVLDNPNTDEVLPVLRRNSHEEVIVGSHMYPGHGVYLLKFDNSYSLLRSKTLYYRVYYTK